MERRKKSKSVIYGILKVDSNPCKHDAIIFESTKGEIFPGKSQIEGQHDFIKTSVTEKTISELEFITN